MKHHLQYHWWKYLLAVLLPIVIWCVIFDVVGRPKQNERLRVLFIGETLDVRALQTDLSAAMPQLTEQPLKEITVTQTQPGALALGELLTARQFDYDLVILEDDCPEKVGQNFFAPLSDAIIDRIPAAAAYTERVEDTSLSYGYELSLSTRFVTYLTAPQDCVLFFSTESVNLDSLNGKGSTGDDAALCAAEFLLEESD